MKKTTILYLMNVDWRWIKQRPHFLAEKLGNFFDLFVLYPFSWQRKSLLPTSPYMKSIYPLFRLPFSSKSNFILAINSIILKSSINFFLFVFKPEIIWIASPEMFYWIPKNHKLKIIYDCMDDVLAFPSNSDRIQYLMNAEVELIKASAIVFFSSRSLEERVIGRSNSKVKSIVVNNAFDAESFNSYNNILNSSTSISTSVRLGYIGTISSWFNLPLLLDILNKCPDITIYLIGPVDASIKMEYKHPRLLIEGPVKHDLITKYLDKIDAFLMPFHLSPLIECVDPVKMYEYIYFNKPIFSIYYPEMKKFYNFVDFFSTSEGLITLIKKYRSLSFKPKFSCQLRDRFLQENSWDERVKVISQAIKSEYFL